MRKAIFFIFALTGCGSALPSIEAVSSPAERATMTRACLKAFPTGKWTATHSIDATMPLGHNALMIGVTDVGTEGITTVLLSPEGLTLFEALSKDGKVNVRRVLPPLDQKGFAEGLVEDVRGTFIPPEGPPTIVGNTDEGVGMCRWTSGEEKTTDIVLDGGYPRWVKMFAGEELLREVHVIGEASDGWHHKVVLRTQGMGAYTLEMQLIDREVEAE